MVDIHSHILTDLDDGAKVFEVTTNLIDVAVRGGVTNIICTPHFLPDEQDLEEFLKLRQVSFDKTEKYILENNIPLKIHLGLEISFNPSLIEMIDGLKNIDSKIMVKNLCLAESRYMLLELPNTTFPIWAEQYFFELQLRGIIPVIAHIERYEWSMSEKEQLCKWAESGVIFQANASLLDFAHTSKHNKTRRYLLKNDLISLVASDAHDIQGRSMNSLLEVFGDNSKIKQEDCKKWVRNGFTILENNDIILPE